jgi:SAM-dependent methyltransferase
MGAASHLGGIDLREYDTRIRTFIPGYDAMLDVAAAALATTASGRSPVIVDLGIGTGALAARCRAAKPSARIVGVDEDEGMLAAARNRLGRALLTGLSGNFETVDLPGCNAVTASLALHHIPTPGAGCGCFAGFAGPSAPAASSSRMTATSRRIRGSSGTIAWHGWITCRRPTRLVNRGRISAPGGRKTSTRA